MNVRPERTLRLALLAAPLAASQLLAADVVILRARDLGPYNEAIAGFRKVCTREAPVAGVAPPAEPAALAVQVRAEKPKVLLAVGTKAARFARTAVPEIPMVFCMVEDPEGNEVLGPNVTGVRMQIPYRRQLEMMRTAFPDLDLLGILYDPARTRDDVPAAIAEAKALGIAVATAEVHAPGEVVGAFATLHGKGVDLLWLTTDPTVLDSEVLGDVVGAANAKGVPIVAPGSRSVKAGDFLSIAPSYPRIGEQAGRLVNRILAGTKAADIPIETPEGTLAGAGR